MKPNKISLLNMSVGSVDKCRPTLHRNAERSVDENRPFRGGSSTLRHRQASTEEKFFLSAEGAQA